MSNNKVSYVTLFAYKAGYGTGFAVGPQGTPGTSAFTVSDSPYARAALSSGKFLNIMHRNTTIMEATVDHWVAGPGFLTIFTKSPMAAAPTVGDQIEPLSTAMKYINNSCSWTGDNCYDVNGWNSITITNQTCNYAGEYKPAGAPFNGLATCIWLGYDPQDTNSTYRGLYARISGTVADHVGGTGIMVTEGVVNVVVDNYRLTNINELNHPGDLGCAISLNPLNTNPNSRGSDLHIGRGTITASTPNSCLAWIENSTGNTINGLTGTASNGITIDAGGGDSVTNTQVTATGTADGTFAYAVGAGGGEHEIGVIFRGNRGQLTAPAWGPSSGGTGHGYGFINMSPANSGIDVDGSNSVGANGAGFVPRAGF